MDLAVVHVVSRRLLAESRIRSRPVHLRLVMGKIVQVFLRVLLLSTDIIASMRHTRISLMNY
jgi:hypothetical protein